MNIQVRKRATVGIPMHGAFKCLFTITALLLFTPFDVFLFKLCIHTQSRDLL